MDNGISSNCFIKCSHVHQNWIHGSYGAQKINHDFHFISFLFLLKFYECVCVLKFILPSWTISCRSLDAWEEKKEFVNVFDDDEST